VARIIVTDSGPIGLACDNPKKPEVTAFLNWMARALSDGRTRVYLPGIVDYEVRRNLLTLPNGKPSLARLDELVRVGNLMIFAPITDAAMKRAAGIWADARQGGYQTADDRTLDGDVILAGHAFEIVGLSDRLFVATGNESHLARYLGGRTLPWEAITP